MAGGPSESKKLKLQSEYKSADWETVFSLTSVQTLYPAFAVLQLGPDCNAHMSVPFSDAKCNFRKVGLEGCLYMIDFDDIFTKGIDLLIDLNNNSRELTKEEQRAVDILDHFLADKEKHEESLHKVLEGSKSEEDNDKKTNSFDTDVTIALAEHLLGKLAPGQPYVIDDRTRRGQEEMCKCGLDHCNGRPNFDSTGIGDEKAWHGFIDIIFPSHPVAAITVQELCGDENDEESEILNDEDPPCEKTKCEMKLNCNHGAENQAIAQTIVFSYIQRKRHPSFQNYLIPNIVISPYHFRILMYDSLNDILICSVKLPIFQDKEKTEKLRVESIVFLWMVLHYRIFCVGIDISELLKSGSIENLRDIQSNFPERAREKFSLYEESSRIDISRFLPTPEESFPSFDSFLYGYRLFTPRRLKTFNNNNI